MPASAKRKAERRLKFGRPPLEGRNEATSPGAETPSEPDSENGGVALQSADPPSQEPASGSPDAPAPTTTKDPKARYILFVGNLPYNATTTGVEQHFASVRPTQVRHRTDKATGKSRGFAFVEFDSYARMDACLTRYHRSQYLEGREAPDETKAERQGDGAEAADGKFKMEGPKGSRRINVQLTAGGGGTGEQRRKRLQEKNEKLDRERHKRLKKARDKKERNKAKKPKGAEGAAGEQDSFAAEEGMHPSRRAQFAQK